MIHITIVKVNRTAILWLLFLHLILFTSQPIYQSKSYFQNIGKEITYIMETRLKRTWKKILQSQPGISNNINTWILGWLFGGIFGFSHHNSQSKLKNMQRSLVLKWLKSRENYLSSRFSIWYSIWGAASKCTSYQALRLKK